MPPSSIGPFKIERELGRGGMGVVYLAQDSRLGRRVAIKALPDHFAADPDRLARFNREAKTLASLNHPNVAQIYGVEEQEGRKYLVLEYVEGRTLAERLDQGALPIDETLDLCTGIAAGLEAAHEGGVIHRDLKPANIKITPEGKIKVLDFGLARTQDDGSSTLATSGSPDSPTLSIPTPMTAHSPTMPGAILGTAAYMSPEQARGRRVDRRSDVWSFGVILFECLTGVSPFAGETASDSIGAVLHKPIDLALLPPNTPQRIRDLIGRTLERDREKRLRDLGDAMLEIERARLEAYAAPPAPVRRGPGWPIVVAAGLMGLAGIAAAAYSMFGRALATAPVTTAPRPQPKVTLSQVTDMMGPEGLPTLSPDGSTVVYAADAGGNTDLYSLRIGGVNASDLTAESTAHDHAPAYSPDGQSIAFRSERDGGGIFIMGATGESPRRLTNEGFDPEWSPDGASIVYATEGIIDPLSRTTISRLIVVNVGTGATSTILESDGVQPAWSPSGARIAFWSVTGGGQRDIFTIPSAGGEPVPVTSDPPLDWSPAWSPDGRFLYFISDRGGSQDVWRVPIGEQSGKTTGAFEPITRAPGSTLAFLTIARQRHRLAFMAGSWTSRLMRLDLDPVTSEARGEPRPLLNITSSSTQAAIAPDGRQVVWSGRRGNQEDIFVVSADGSGRRRITDDAAKDRGPVWMPDGQSIVFYSDRSGTYQVWSIRPDGSGLRALTTNPDGVTLPAVAPDGSAIAYISRAGGAFMLRLDQDAPKEEGIPPPAEGERVFFFSWSPKGGRLLAMSGRTGTAEVSRLSVYDVESKRYETVLADLTDADARFMPDGRRILILDAAGLSVLDPADGSRRAMWKPARRLELGSNLSLAPDGSWMCFNAPTIEADLWIADVEDAP